MLIGELYDLLTEKLQSGEFSRLDVVVISDMGDPEDYWFTDTLSKVNGDFVRIESTDLGEDMTELYFAANHGDSEVF